MTTTLTEAIRASGLTKTECAEAAGVSRSQLYMYETGKLRPELKNAVRIAEALGVEVGGVVEFRPALEEAESRRVKELMERVQEQVLKGGREVHIAIGELPGWLSLDYSRSRVSLMNRGNVILGARNRCLRYKRLFSCALIELSASQPKAARSFMNNPG